MAKRPFPLRLSPNKEVVLLGGPYRERPVDMFGVKMAVEIDAACDVSIPTRDFSTPTINDVDKGLIETLEAILAGKKSVYVGCMGGIGRTGLFLAVLAKAFGLEALHTGHHETVGGTVGYVRANYLGHAVETRDQQLFIQKYQVPFKAKVLVQAIKFKARFWRGYGLTRPATRQA